MERGNDSIASLSFMIGLLQECKVHGRFPKKYFIQTIETWSPENLPYLGYFYQHYQRTTQKLTRLIIINILEIVKED